MPVIINVPLSKFCFVFFHLVVVAVIMKSKTFLSAMLLGYGLVSASCNNPAKPESVEKEKVLKVAGEIAFREYGNVIKDELPLKAQLVSDSIWVIQGTLAKNMLGGTVYIELSKTDHRILKITHYK